MNLGESGDGAVTQAGSPASAGLGATDRRVRDLSRPQATLGIQTPLNRILSRMIPDKTPHFLGFGAKAGRIAPDRP